ncbi:DUF4142 domain-containing protein [Chitinophaga alhagiae]|uniref:DUF4142 domain-containing protein n=1 Tax=Chitinophaga alhagiae TaxID=2203219 RepID=UPI000E5C327F|nr:DUF4142 domain-containing protein [Chitinophaga alhagiae]
MKRILLPFAIACLAIVACNNNASRNAQDTLSGEDTGMTQDMAQDINKETMEGDSVRAAADNISKAAEDGMYEVKLLQDGQAKTTNAGIKKMSGHMLKAHEKLNKDLADLTAKKGITIPTALEDARVKDIQQITDKSGTDFDKAYVDELVDKHEKAVQLFETVANDATDPDIKALFTKALPELRMHLDMAKKEQDKLKK